jgi:hypothetical protein
MQESAVLRQIGRPGADPARVAARVAGDPELITQAIQGVGVAQARTKYRCAKVLRLISESRPQALYPFLDSLVALLDGSNNIIKWEAIRVIGNLAAVDRENKIDRILGKYLAPIAGTAMITAANAMGGAATIAVAKPYLAEAVAQGIMQVEHARYRTAECRNVALGHAILAFDRFFDRLEHKEPVLALIRKQLSNPRPATRKKAEKFIRKWDLDRQLKESRAPS